MKPTLDLSGVVLLDSWSLRRERTSSSHSHVGTVSSIATARVPMKARKGSEGCLGLGLLPVPRWLG